MFWKKVRWNVKRAKMTRTRGGNSYQNSTRMKFRAASADSRNGVDFYKSLYDRDGDDQPKNTYRRFSWTCASSGSFSGTSCIALRDATFKSMPSKTWLQRNSEINGETRPAMKILSAHRPPHETNVRLKSSITTQWVDAGRIFVCFRFLCMLPDTFFIHIVNITFFQNVIMNLNNQITAKYSSGKCASPQYLFFKIEKSLGIIAKNLWSIRHLPFTRRCLYTQNALQCLWLKVECLCFGIAHWCGYECTMLFCSAQE